MIKEQFGYVVAEYHDLESVIAAEVDRADLIVIDGYVPGGIYFPVKVNWRGSLAGIDDVKQFIRSKTERKEVDSNRDYFLSRNFELTVLPLNEEIFAQFFKLYQETVLSKERALHLDVEKKILSQIKLGAQIYLLGLFSPEKKLAAGLIFDVSQVGEKQEAHVYYGAKKRFDEIRGGAGGVLEYELLRYCQQQGITEINHGRARNPAGLVSNSGIFEFKARYGHTAYPDGSWKTMFIKNPAVALTDWVFVTIIDNALGYLVIAKEPKPDTKNKYLTREVKIVKVIGYEEASEQYRNFIQQNLPVLSK